MSEFNRDDLKYRLGAQGIIYRNNKILICQEIQRNDNEWGFPGGQAEPNETDEETIKRELREEFPKSNFNVIKKSNVLLRYEWPDEMIEADISKKGWSYRGQSKVQFLVELLDEDIDTYNTEEIKWVEKIELKKYLIFPGQYQTAVETLKDLGIL